MEMEGHDVPPTKRLRFSSPPGTVVTPENTLPAHPLHVRPEGNAYAEKVISNLKWNSGFFAGLPDEVLMIMLETLAASELLSLGSTCKALYAFTRSDELWKALFVE
jgi:hypothetical protein